MMNPATVLHGSGMRAQLPIPVRGSGGADAIRTRGAFADGWHIPAPSCCWATWADSRLRLRDTPGRAWPCTALPEAVSGQQPCNGARAVGGEPDLHQILARLPASEALELQGL